MVKKYPLSKSPNSMRYLLDMQLDMQPERDEGMLQT